MKSTISHIGVRKGKGFWLLPDSSVYDPLAVLLLELFSPVQEPEEEQMDRGKARAEDTWLDNCVQRKGVERGGMRTGGSECKTSGNRGQREHNKFREPTETPLSLIKPKQQ